MHRNREKGRDLPTSDISLENKIAIEHDFFIRVQLPFDFAGVIEVGFQPDCHAFCKGVQLT